MYFFQQLFQRFSEQIHKLVEEKYNKYMEVLDNYQTQIKEMEFIINGGILFVILDSEDSHQEGIKAVIDALKEEQENELERVEMHYNSLIAEAQNNFKSLSVKTNPGVQLIEEKFKLDMYTLLNTILLPKKN
jgi:coenzyme F420-reducing hydrogenase alpha subunit